MTKVAPGEMEMASVPGSPSASGDALKSPTIMHRLQSSIHGLDERRGQAVFIASNGKMHYYAPYAMGFLSMENPIRQMAMRVITNRWFDRSILLCIMVNSLIMALEDYSVIDDEYEPIGKNSWRNSLADNTEMFFVVAFTLEMVFKIVGMGLRSESYQNKDIKPPDTYLRDYWNMLDCFVVVTGFAAFVPGLPSVSVIRTFRVLRPLKSVSGLEGVKMVIVAVANSIDELISVLVLLAFVFAVFGILGLQFFSGLSHSRCRLTPYPVTTDWVVGLDPANYRCLDTDDYGSGRSSNFNKPSHQAWNKASSAWSTPQPCYWPLDEEDDRLCHFKGNGGLHMCYHGDYFTENILPYNPDAYETWCGSNWDALGNVRFAAATSPLDIFGQDHAANGRTYDQETLLWSANFNENLSWGLVDFDNFLKAFLTILQVITLEGWVFIMYPLMDAGSPFASVLFFVCLVAFGSFFVLQLVLAVLEENYNEQEELMTKRLKQEAEEAEAEAAELLANQPLLTDDEIGAKIDQAAGWNSDFPMGDFDFGATLVGVRTSKDANKGFFSANFAWCLLNPHTLDSESRPAWCNQLNDLVNHPKFSFFITMCIVFNTVALAMDHHPMDKDFEDNLEIANFVFTLVFVAEMLLKLPGLGVRLYMQDSFNVFDCLIVCVSIVESIVTPPSFIVANDGAAGGGISALRSFRLFRVFKLAREWEAMRVLLDLIAKTAVQMSNFMVLFLIFIYIYALMGMQFFGARMHFDDLGYRVEITEGGNRDAWEAAEVPRMNFDTIHWAAATIFMCLTGEDWHQVMYDGMRAGGIGFGAFYFMTLMVVGFFVVMNLFMAILLANFDELGTSKPAQEAENDGKVAPDPNAPLTAIEERRKVAKDLVQHGAGTQLGQAISTSIPASFTGEGASSASMDSQGGNVAAAGSPSAGAGMQPLDTGGSTSVLRMACARLVKQKWFDHGILGCILLSTVALAMDSPLNNPHTALSQFMLGLDWVMTVIFSFEMAVKMIGLGLWGHSEAYLTNGWNLMDGVIVIVGWIGLLADDSLSAFKALRALRALKPLRMINRFPGLQVVVGTMISSVGSIVNVAIVTILVFVIFSIVAVNYLKGKFYMCMGDAFDEIAGTAAEEYLTTPYEWSRMEEVEKSWFQVNSTIADFSADGLGCVTPGDGCCTVDLMRKPTSQEICECWGMDWERSGYWHFDNTWVALGAFFQISTTEGWMALALLAVDARDDVGMQPIVNNNELWLVFFVIFMVIGGFLMTNLFVGVIISNFNELKAQKEAESQETGEGQGDIFMTEDQKLWTMTQKLLAKMLEFQVHKAKPPVGAPIKAKLFEILSTDKFDAFIISCIIANTCVMAIGFFGQDDAYSFALDCANFAFAMVFNFECVFKLYAFEKHYFYTMLGNRLVLNNWNIFDFIVVAGTNLGIATTGLPDPNRTGGGGGGTGASVVRMFRIGRLLRLINGAKDIKKMFDTLIATLPGLANVATVLFLLFFIFAVIGVQLFSTVAYHGELGPHTNFRNFGMALLTLARFATGENWNGFMYDTAHSRQSDFHGTTEETLNSDASHPNAPVNDGTGWCDPSVLYDDVFVGGDYDGQKYGDVMCGFATWTHDGELSTQADGCVELNGCASFFIYPYLKCFTLLVTFVFLNLFVGIILDGFSQPEGNEESVIPEADFFKIWDHWTKLYDPEETYCIDVFKVKSFLQTLDKPWGFGLDYVATDAELIHRVRDLNLTVGPDGKIHFFKVLKGFSRRHMSLTHNSAMAEIDDFERKHNDTELKSTLRSSFARSIPNFTESLGSKGSGEESLTEILARMVIRKAIKHWLRRKHANLAMLASAKKATLPPLE